MDDDEIEWVEHQELHELWYGWGWEPDTECRCDEEDDD